MRKSLDRSAQTVPYALIEVFEGYNHGELSIGNPETFVVRALEFFAH